MISNCSWSKLAWHEAPLHHFPYLILLHRTTIHPKIPLSQAVSHLMKVLFVDEQGSIDPWPTSGDQEHGESQAAIRTSLGMVNTPALKHADDLGDYGIGFTILFRFRIWRALISQTPWIWLWKPMPVTCWLGFAWMTIADKIGEYYQL